MNLKIDSGYDIDTTSERISLIATGDGNTKDYLILDTTYDKNGNVSNKFKHAFRFPDKPFKKGDIIRLYSKKGTDNTVPHPSKADVKVHSFYWDVQSGIWNDKGDNALLIKIAGTAVKPIC